MKLEIPKCPECGEIATGTFEMIPGIAFLTAIDSDGEVEYAGETKVLWDGQRAVVRDGKYTLLCCNHHEWQSAIDGYTP